MFLEPVTEVLETFFCHLYLTFCSVGTDMPELISTNTDLGLGDVP
jgi:hypothetical protein